MKRLKKRLADHNSKLWRTKADNMWRLSVIIRDCRRCVICGSSRFVQAHHLIPREMYSHRHIVANGVTLCVSHHKFSFELSPHKAPIEFIKWLRLNNIVSFDWLMEQTPTRNHQSFRQTYLDLLIDFNKLYPIICERS